MPKYTLPEVKQESSEMDKEMVARVIEKLEHTEFVLRLREENQQEMLL